MLHKEEKNALHDDEVAQRVDKIEQMIRQTKVPIDDETTAVKLFNSFFVLAV